MSYLHHHGIPTHPYEQSILGEVLFDAESQSIESPKKQAVKPKKKGRRTKKIARYTLEDIEKPAVTAESRLLEGDNVDIFFELLEQSVRYRDSVPFYKLLLRLFSGSIEDYCQNPRKHAGEVDFWRGKMCHYYGEMLCEFTRLVFDIDVSLEGLRRAAEHKMGLAPYTLSPDCTSLVEAEQASVQVANGFSKIVRTHGHLHDPEADAFFEVRRRPARARSRKVE